MMHPFVTSSNTRDSPYPVGMTSGTGRVGTERDDPTIISWKRQSLNRPIDTLCIAMTWSTCCSDRLSHTNSEKRAKTKEWSVANYIINS